MYILGPTNIKSWIEKSCVLVLVIACLSDVTSNIQSSPFRIPQKMRRPLIGFIYLFLFLTPLLSMLCVVLLL